MQFFKRQEKDLDKHITKNDIQMVNKDIKCCLTSLTISEMQIKVTVQNHHTLLEYLVDLL